MLNKFCVYKNVHKRFFFFEDFDSDLSFAKFHFQQFPKIVKKYKKNLKKICKLKKKNFFLIYNF